MDDKHFEKIDIKLEKIENSLNSINITLALNTLSLDTHIKRTNLLEENMEFLRADFKPISSHVTLMNNIFKIIVFIGIISAIIKNLK